MKEPRIFQTMQAEMKPDIYVGENCDEHIPQWWIYAEGDMGDDVMTSPLILDPKLFPPGTRIIISEPFCPECEMRRQECSCGFDWKAWIEEKYS